MWIRFCDCCRTNLEVDRRRFIRLKGASVLFFLQKDKRFHAESVANGEITVCEVCSKNFPIAEIFKIIEKRHKEGEDVTAGDS
jgi:hypothetical protein